MSTNGAIGLLYQVWGYEVDIKEAWCDQAWRANLTCQSGTESLEALEAQGLPWIAPLEMAGKTVPVVVIGEHDDELIALTTQRTWRIKKSWFSSVWRGRYTLLWKPSPDGKSVVNKKSSLEEIVWLDTMLSRVLNLEAEETGEWSPLLQEKIRQFQAQKALTADGVMGQLSLIRLWQALGESPAFIHEEGNK
ncbi:peptidoglycan-binding protein [Citrobacter rodentium NBRC 105723 = DSM 16636]|nr:peptidoglycan-binding protein [Citrobacter rodentium NBRC 105723 = DSM 16636]